MMNIRMRFRAYLLTGILLLSGILVSRGQSEVDVDHFRGLASVRIPLADFNIKGYNSKIYLEYEARSVKVKSSADELPLGWTLEAGGNITRILKGLPDEYQKSGDSRKGWLNTGISGLPQTFSIANDNDPNTCTDEGSNRSSILSNWGYTLDSEPDWFVVNAPGLNCKVVLDNTNTFKVIPAQDLKIEFLDQGTANPYFVITNTEGVKYTFKTAAVTTKSISRAYTNTALEIFNREYEYYKTPLTYIHTWYLDNVTAFGNETSKVSYLYSQLAEDPSSSQSSVSSLSTGTNTFSDVPVYLTANSGYKQQLNQIRTNLQTLTIVRNPSPNEKMRFDIVSGPGSVVSIALQSKNLNSGTRPFLQYVTETAGGCTSILYKFEYYGCDFSNLTSTLPVTNSEKYDAWGYFNNLLTKRQLNVFPGLTSAAGIYKPYPLSGFAGENYSLNGTDPVIDEASINAGVMSKITYPTGGSSYFEYESNSFWDQDGNVEIKGNGVRIKKLTHFDGINPSKAMVTEFAYSIPGQSRTSGTIKSLPQIAITTNSFNHPNNSGASLSNAQVLSLTPQNSADYWKYLTLINKDDLDNLNGDGVVYQYVTAKEKDNGRTEYKFSISSDLWSVDANSMVYPAMVCSGSKPAGLPVKNGYMQYPFPPKENAEYGEGLPLEAKIFSETNKQVRTTEYEYEDYTSTPQIINGIAFDLLYGNLLFSRYGLVLNSKILKKEKITIFDTGVSTNSNITEVVYDNSAPDRNVRSKTVTNSDNTIMKTSYTYNGDMSVGAGQISGDPFAEGSYWLNQQYMKNVLLEELEERKEPGSAVFKAYAGNIFLYKKNTLTGLPVLAEKKSFKNINGLSALSPIAFNGTNLVYNNNYKTDQVLADFDANDLPQSVTSKRIKQGLAYPTYMSVPAAVFTGVDLSNVAFATFDDNVGNLVNNNFVPADYTQDAHTGSRAGILRNGNDLSRTFTKSDGSRVYNVSLWGKSVGGGTINILINNSSVGSIVVSASSQYGFYQQHINISSIPASSTIKLTTTGNITVDDIGFAPEEVNYEFVTYNYPVGKASETNSSGKTMYYEYDKKGRPTITRDADKNILKYQSYRNYNLTGAVLSANIQASSEVMANTSTVLGTANGCIDGVKYTWNFGDGSTLVTYDPTVSHSFAPGGPYTVSLTAYHPDYGTRTSTHTVSIKLDVQICIAGPKRKDLCGIVATVMGDCTSGFPAPSSGSKIYVNWLSGCQSGATYQYQWQQLVNGTWIDVGTNQNQFAISQSLGITQVRCKVTSSCGSVGYSNTATVEYYKSQNCPIIEE